MHTQSFSHVTLCYCLVWKSHFECICAEFTGHALFLLYASTGFLGLSASVICVNLRHSHVAAVYDNVSELRTSRLVGQLQRVGSPQRLMESSQTSHRWRGGVVCRRSPGCAAVKAHVADGLIGRGPVEGLSRLRRKLRGKQMLITKWEQRQWFITWIRTKAFAICGHVSHHRSSLALCPEVCRTGRWW